MYWKPVKFKNRNIGKFIILKNIAKQKKYKLYNQFLENFLRHFLKENYQYFIQTGCDWAFNYGEKQLHSVLYPAFYKTAKICFLEFPVYRIIGRKKKRGFVDYLIPSFDYDIAFVIEVKHKVISLSRNYFSSIEKKWDGVVNQIHTLKPKNILYSGPSNALLLGLVCIPLLIKKRFKSEYDKDTLIEEVNEIYNSLNPKPNWYSIVKIDDAEEDFIRFTLKDDYIDDSRICIGICIFIYKKDLT